MTSPNPAILLANARRRYISARTILWNAHGALVGLNVDQEHLTALEQALLDNQTSIDYLHDIIRTLTHQPDSKP